MRGFLLLVCLLSSFSCTRGGITPKMNLSIGAIDGQGGLDANDQLSVVIVNVKVPGRGPIVREVDYHDGPTVIMGQPINLEIQDIPSGDGFFIQVLAVYENQVHGAMKFLYGDATANVRADTTVNITADNAGSSNIMVRVAGRYLTSEGPDVGPTGVMIAQFLPPNGKPAMNVERSYMVNGWFQAFAIDSATAGFRYVMADGTVIFDGFNASSSFLTPSAKLLKVIKPVSARRENRGSGSEIRVSSEAHAYLGYFNQPASGKNVCFVDTVEGVAGLFTSAALTTPMKWDASTGSAADIRVAGGGTASTYGVFANNDATCTQSAIDNGSALVFHHFNSDDEEGFSGFNVPYRSLRPLDIHRAFLLGEIDLSNPGAPVWNLKWDYLPGAATAVTATEIWYQVSAGGGGGGGDRSCENMIKDGYTLAGETLTSAGSPEAYSFSGNGLDNSNYWNYRFAACAYRTVGGVKQYLGKPAQGDCLSGNCGSFDHFGWGTSDIAPGGATNFQTLGGRTQRITDVTPFPGYTEIAINSTSGLVVGSEVMVLVNGSGANGDCGSYQGHPVQVGEFAFTRLLHVGSFPRLAKGTFLDVLGTANLSGSPDASNFCYIQMLQVPHFHNLDLSGSLVSVNAFDYAANGGGLIALRVSGTLNLGQSGNGFDATGAGYPGGSNTIPNGGGDRRAPSATVVGHLGGRNQGDGASGGGGYGNGGNAGTGGATQGGQGLNSGGGGGYYPRLVFGGGGVGVGAPGTGAGNGGGAVLIMANRITSYSGVISANGQGGSSYSGGGGGSINVITRELTGQGTGGVNFLVQGAAGSSASGSYGGGGGGYVAVTACQSDMTGATNFVTTGGAGDGLTITGSGGASGYGAYSSANNFWMCQ